MGLYYKLAIALFCYFATTIALESIGEFDEKFYWVEKTNTNFSSAGNFCRQFGWQLLTLDSEQEFTYLRGAVANHTNNNGYWTTAVSTHTYQWNYGNGTILDPFRYPVTIEYQTCVVFWGGNLTAHPCEGAPTRVYYPLCQMRNAHK